MKHRLTITLITTAILVSGGYWAIKNNIGKFKNVTAITCEGEIVYNVGKIRGKSFPSTASILVTAEYYPWETNKTYTIDYKNENNVFQGSTNDKSVGNAAAGNGVYVSQSVDQHNIHFFRQGRSTYDNPDWTKKEMHERWMTSSYSRNLMINLVTMKIKFTDNHSHYTMKNNSSLSGESIFHGNCTITKPTFKI
jgi:hypothetical protein